nr:RNA polymerase factor sigma-54 [uncultured Cetobacterium sp.]
MDFKLDMSQSLKLSLSLEMKMSIEILKMAATDLKDFIKDKAKDNPCIEVEYSQKKIGKDDAKDQLIESVYEEENLIDYLEEQIGYLDLDKKIKEIVIFLINNLDERGYLSFSHKELRKTLNIGNREYQNAVSVLTDLDPSGVGAENLKDCLKIQLRKKGQEDEILFKIIDNNLEDIAGGNLNRICEDYNITKEIVLEYISDIRKLNPKPARGFIVNSKIEYIIPDIIVDIEDGDLIIKLNNDDIPKLKIKKDEGNSKDISFAIALLRCLEKRQNTLLKVSTYILDYQRDYILKNKKMKTLKIKDIAYDLNLHESTISRAIKDKYIKINGEIKSLRSYTLLNSEYEAIKEEILKIVDEENKLKPYSDEKIVTILKSMGLNLVRRTVTKYREELGIPSSRDRKNNR